MVNRIKENESKNMSKVFKTGKLQFLSPAVWNFDNGKCLRTFKHIHQVNTVAIHGDAVVSGCEGGRVKVWSIKDACLIKVNYCHVWYVLFTQPQSNPQHLQQLPWCPVLLLWCPVLLLWCPLQGFNTKFTFFS